MTAPDVVSDRGGTRTGAEMESLGFAVIAAGMVGYSLISGRLQGTSITPPIVFILFGLAIGSSGLGLAKLDLGHSVIHTLAEVTLILVLFSDAARIDLRLLRRDHDLPVRMLAIGLPLTIVGGAVVAVILFAELSIWEAALLAAILAPTDAALGQAVVSNPLVPVRIRQALNVESGLNDGIALPVVLLLAACAAAVEGDGRGTAYWVQFGAMQVILGPMAGIAVGYFGGRLIDAAAQKGWLEESFEGLTALGLAIVAFALAELVHGNGFISAFVAGLVFGNTVRGRCGFLFEFAEAEGQILTFLTFMIFGAAMMPMAAGHLDWRIILYAALSLTVIRMIPVSLSLAGAGLGAPTHLFLGWFGPRGLASILFALLILEEAEIAHREELMIVTIVTVALSALLHGLSAAPAAGRYASLAATMGDCEEKKPVAEMPTRAGMPATDRQE